MWHKPCRTFHPWCLCIKTRCLWNTVFPVACLSYVMNTSSLGNYCVTCPLGYMFLVKGGRNELLMLVYTGVICHADNYSAMPFIITQSIFFLQNSHNRNPIVRPWGRALGCLLWGLCLIFVLPLSSQCWILYREKYDRVIKALDCT